MICSFAAMSILTPAFSRNEKLPRDTCDPGAVAIGEWKNQLLCSDFEKKKLKIIRYDIRQFGAEFDLSETAELAGDLASASKTSIIRDKHNPNFVVFLIANDTPVDLEQALASIQIKGAKYGAEKFRKSVRDYQEGITQKALTFGSQNALLYNIRGEAIFVVVLVQKMPTVFLASNIVDNMMYALGLSVGVRHDHG